LNEVEKLLENALEAAGRVDRPSSKSADYAAIAEIYLRHGQVERCLGTLKLAAVPADRIKLPAEKAVCLAQIAGLYHAAGEASNSRELFTRAELLARAAETAALQIKALSDIAREYIRAGLETEARNVMDRIYGLVKDPQNGLDIACELIDLAAAYGEANLPDTAGKVLAEATAAALALKDNWFRAERLIGAAEAYVDLDHISRAGDLLDTATPVIREIAAIDRAAFWLRMAEVYRLAGDKPRSLEVLQAALESVKLNSEADYQAENLVEIARLYFSLDPGPAAGEMLELSRRKSREIEDSKDKISVLIKNADLLGQMAEKAQAVEIAGQALDLCRAYPHKQDTLYLLGSLAVACAGLGEKEKVAEIVSVLGQIAVETRAKTTGLGALAGELSEAGEPQQAIILAGLINEPHTRAECLARIAGSLAAKNN
jgi:tetratricopeptide (TPR) repeat protein